MAMFKARAAGGDERFEKFGILCDFLQKSKGCSADVFVRMLLKIYNDYYQGFFNDK